MRIKISISILMTLATIITEAQKNKLDSSNG
jgi:hypothetical protein